MVSLHKDSLVACAASYYAASLNVSQAYWAFNRADGRTESWSVAMEATRTAEERLGVAARALHVAALRGTVPTLPRDNGVTVTAYPMFV